MPSREVEKFYTVIVYDYDAAPDAECYHVGKRLKCETLRDAKLDAHEHVDEKFYVGAKVLDPAGQQVYSIGLTLDKN